MLSGKASEAQRAEFDRLMQEDAEFRQFVEDLRLFMRADGELAPVVRAPDGLLGDIMDEIDASESTSPAPRASSRETRGMQTRDVRREPWRSVAIISALAAGVAIAAHFVPIGGAPALQEPGARDMLAVLSDEDAPQLVMIIYDREAGEILARYENVELPEERVWQLWLIREGEEAPLSLGVFEPAETGTELRVPREERPASANDVLAISLEPPGGAQGPAPTGPILFTGRVGSLSAPIE